MKRLQGSIDSLEKKLPHFKATAIPIQFSSGSIINGSLVKAYVKKLPKHTRITAEMDEFFVILRHPSGSIFLKNNAEHYEGMKLPKGEEFLDELGITIH